MNLKLKVPSIPIEGSISYEDWLKGRRFRRQLSKLVAPGRHSAQKQFQRPPVEEIFQGRTRPAFYSYR